MSQNGKDLEGQSLEFILTGYGKPLKHFNQEQRRSQVYFLEKSYNSMKDDGSGLSWR